ncbi:MAG TPA: hypothetical protein ENN43_07180 [bacterium]|nr:hypothetical protein [bacterium]
MKLILITDEAKNDMRLMNKKKAQAVYDFIFKTLSRRVKPMDSYPDTYRVKADFFRRVSGSYSIHFERSPKGKITIARITENII